MIRWIFGGMLVLIFAAVVVLVQQQREINSLRHEVERYGCLQSGERWDPGLDRCINSE
jgi:hypothetical protein